LIARTSNKSFALSDSISTVNWMEVLRLLRWLKKFCNLFGPRGQTPNESTKHHGSSSGLHCAESIVRFAKHSSQMSLTRKARELPIAMPYFSCKNLSFTESRWLSDEFHDNFNLENGPFRQCAIDVLLISDDLYSFAEGC
jgi:hypothetical protein